MVEERISEDWIKEYEKTLITKEIHNTAQLLKEAEFTVYEGKTPIEKRASLMKVIASLTSIITSLPLLPKNKNVFKEWNERLEEIKNILYCEPETMKKYGLTVTYYREKLGRIKIPGNEGKGFFIVLKKLKELFFDINNFTTQAGLRITLPLERKVGAKAILESNNLTPEDLELLGD